MSFEQIREQAARLTKEEQGKLLAFLVSLRTDEDDEDFKERMARKIDDNDPSHWIDLDELERRLAE